MAKVKIDEDKCIACGVCQDIAPEVFEVEDVCKIIAGCDYEKNKELIEDAINNCPQGAISIED